MRCSWDRLVDRISTGDFCDTMHMAAVVRRARCAAAWWLVRCNTADEGRALIEMVRVSAGSSTARLNILASGGKP